MFSCPATAVCNVASAGLESAECAAVERWVTLVLATLMRSEAACSTTNPNIRHFVGLAILQSAWYTLSSAFLDCSSACHRVHRHETHRDRCCMTRQETTVPTMKWVYITGAAFVVTLLAAIAFITVAGRVRMPNGLYFIILIPLGVAAAAFLFGAMHSHATYSGKSPYGTLELSGPVVVLALVVLGGMMANRAETFALTVRVHGPGGPGDIVRDGRLTADLAGVRRTAVIGSDGEVVFADVPADLEGQIIRLTPDVPGLQPDSVSKPTTIPASHIIDVGMARRRFSTPMRGSVQDHMGHPVRGAVLNFDAGGVTAVSDSAGNFRATIAMNAGSVVPLTVSLKNQILYDDNVTISEQPALRIVLLARPP